MHALLERPQVERQAFATALIDWFQQSMRPLPWRKDYTPYGVWISEIMLQQTQMERGVQYFIRWMKHFPTIASVANAPEEDILKAWEGLGYYSRARNLHATAKRIMTEHNGVFPGDVATILSLPGIGPYTAGAIASIAFKQPEPAIDANVERVFARLLDIDTPLTRTGVKAYIRDSVTKLLPRENAREFNQALMELGALVCSKKPNCALCPIHSQCEAKRLRTVEMRPVPGKKAVYTQLEMSTGIACCDGKVLIQKRPPYGVWAGLWEFPGGCFEPGETAEECLIREFWEETELRIRPEEKIAVLRHAYTTCRVTMHAFFCTLQEGPHEPVLHAATEYLWVSPQELVRFTFPSGHRKLLELMVTENWHSGLKHGLGKAE